MEIFAIVLGFLKGLPAVVQVIAVAVPAFFLYGWNKKRQGRNEGRKDFQDLVEKVDEKKAATTRKRGARSVRNDTAGYRDKPK